MPRLIPSRPARPAGARDSRVQPCDAPAPKPTPVPKPMPAPAPDARPGPGPGTGTGTGLGVPAFAHPLVAPAEWAELARPGTPLRWTAFDVARGPGARADPLYVQALERVRENAVPVLGLLDCAYGARPFGELVIDASHYLDWYRVDGFYLDRAPTLRDEAAEARRLTSTLRALLAQEHAEEYAQEHAEQHPGHPGNYARGHAHGDPDGGGSPAGDRGTDRVRIVMAPGAYPHPAYAEIADQLVVFDGPWTRYRWSEAPQWSAQYPAAAFVHLVHSLPPTHLDAALRIARWQGAATVCMTDRCGGDGGAGAWAGLPAYWPDLVRRLREGPGGAPGM